jgi:hypothetical protein
LFGPVTPWKPVRVEVFVSLGCLFVKML